MREYSPKRRTALVLAGSGTTGAYHAGVLRALDESGVKIDLVVGSGIGTVGAAFAAVAGGPKLYDAGGFWDGARWASFYRLRPALRASALLLGSAFGVFLLPLLLAAAAGLLFPLVLIADLMQPGLLPSLLGDPWAALALLRTPFLAALVAPVFVLSVLTFAFLAGLALKRRRRFAEAFEAALDAGPGQSRLRRGLWEVARGATLSTSPASEAELGRRYVSLLAENLGQPGFRELILRALDLDAAGPLPFVVLQDAHRAGFAAARGRGPRKHLEGLPGAVDLRAHGYAELFFDAAVSGLLPPLAARTRRVAFPRGGPFSGETHRLADATLAGDCGLGDALAAGADQVIVVTGAPEAGGPPPRRRGLLAVADAVLAALERRGAEEELRAVETLARVVETLGHRTEDGGRGWQDPVTGRLHRELAVYRIRPERRSLGPLQLDGSRHPATEVVETPADLMDQGYRDAYRLFLEPVVGAVPEPRRAAPVEREEGEAVEL